MSKDDDKGKKKNLPRVDFLHFKNNSPDAFYTEEECEQIRYCWGDDLFTSGIVFKTEEDLKKFDIARERAKEYEKMKREESGGQKNNNVWPKRTDYVRKRPAAKSLIKKKTPKLVDVTNNKEKKGGSHKIGFESIENCSTSQKERRRHAIWESKE